MQPTITVASSDVDQQVKAFILTTIRTFVPPNDTTGKMLYSILRRMLNYATHEDITNVLNELEKFVKGAKASGILPDSDTAEIESVYGRIGDEVPGSWVADREDSTGEIDIGETPIDEILLSISEPEDRVEAAENPSAGHETEMAGDDFDREANPEDVRQHGTGGHDSSDVANLDERLETGLG